MKAENKEKIIEISNKILNLKNDDAINVLDEVVKTICRYEMLSDNDLMNFVKRL